MSFGSPNWYSDQREFLLHNAIMYTFKLTSNILVVMKYYCLIEAHLSSSLVLYLLCSFRKSVMDMNWFSENILRSNSVQNSGGRMSAIASLGSDLYCTQVYWSIKQHSATAISLECCHRDNIHRPYHTLIPHPHHSVNGLQNEHSNIRKQHYCTIPLFIF